MKALDEKITQLRDQTWGVARESLDSGETVVYRSLTDIAEKLTKLIGISDRAPEAVKQNYELQHIFARYKDKKYEAMIDTKRIDAGRGKCILLDGKWWTASGSANNITHTSVNGWRLFWRYDKDGVVTPIEELRKENPNKK